MGLSGVLDPLRQPLVTVLDAPVSRTEVPEPHEGCRAAVLVALPDAGWEFTPPLPERR